MKPVSPVKLEVLQSIQHIEPGKPENNCKAQGQNLFVKCSPYSYPCPERRCGNSDTEHKMRHPGKTLGIRVKDQDQNCQRRELKAQRIKPVRCKNQQCQSNRCKDRSIVHSYFTGRKLPAGCPRVCSVNLSVDNPVEPHSA